jgi:hypothetical protein
MIKMSEDRAAIIGRFCRREEAADESCGLEGAAGARQPGIKDKEKFCSDLKRPRGLQRVRIALIRIAKFLDFQSDCEDSTGLGVQACDGAGDGLIRIGTAEQWLAGAE